MGNKLLIGQYSVGHLVWPVREKKERPLCKGNVRESEREKLFAKGPFAFLFKQKHKVP
jgi:hypothetical protein